MIILFVAIYMLGKDAKRMLGVDTVVVSEISGQERGGSKAGCNFFGVLDLSILEFGSKDQNSNSLFGIIK